MLAGAAALLPVLSGGSAGLAATTAAQTRFAPPAEQLVLTRTVIRQLSGGQQIVVKRRFVIQFVPDGSGYVLNGSQLDVTVEVPPMLSSLAEIERQRVETGLFPAWLDASGLITPKPVPAPGDERAASAMRGAAQSILAASDLPAERKQEGALYLGELSAQPAGSPWPADLFRAAPGERHQHRVVTLPGGEQGQVDVVVRVTGLLPCGLPTTFERQITTVLGGTSRVSHEVWTIELASTQNR